jgi:hypothetical protein
MVLFRKNKEKILQSDIQIVVPSAENLFESYRRNILIASAKLDAQQVSSLDNEQRVRLLIDNFKIIATEALVGALVESGCKEERKKWTIKNWF